MRNLGLLYTSIKDLEEKTLFEFDYINEDNDVYFRYYDEDLQMIVSSEDVIFTNIGANSFIMRFEDMQVVTQLMKILKEFN